jgi:hypothetical protein
MSDNKIIDLGFSRIATEEFATTEEVYDQAKNAEMKLNLNFSFLAEQSTVVVRVKCLLYQEHRLLIVITVSCWFALQAGDWHSRFDETDKTFWLHRQVALHLAGLSVNTTRGVLHGKTENLPVNEIVLPAVNIDELIKEDVILTISG